MGACASKPKDLKKRGAAIPEAPVTPRKPNVETTHEENKDGEETVKEEPLVDLSEPAPEAPKAEEVAAETAPAAAEVFPETTPKPAAEETPAAAVAVEEDKAPKVEEKKEAEAVTEAAEAQTENAPKAPAV